MWPNLYLEEFLWGNVEPTLGRGSRVRETIKEAISIVQVRGDSELTSVWQWDRSRKTKGRILDISKAEPRILANGFDGRREIQRRIKNDELVASEQLDEGPLVPSGEGKHGRPRLVFVFLFLFLLPFTYFVTLFLDFTPIHREAHALCNVWATSNGRSIVCGTHKRTSQELRQSFKPHGNYTQKSSEHGLVWHADIGNFSKGTL